MTTSVTECARWKRLLPSFLAYRGFAAQRSRDREFPLLNLKKIVKKIRDKPWARWRCVIGYAGIFHSHTTI